MIYQSSHNQVVEDLNMKNTSLSTEKDELKTLILEQAQELSGTEEFVFIIYHWQ